MKIGLEIYDSFCLRLQLQKTFFKKSFFPNEALRGYHL